MWIELHDSARDHPKILKLARDLKIPKVNALGHIASLWTWALRMAPDGDLSSFDVDDIEIGAEWNGDSGAFLAAAVERRLIDVQDGAHYLHDWEHYAQHLKAAKRKRDERARKRGRTPTRSQDTTPNVTAGHKTSQDVTGQPRISGPVTQTDRPTDQTDRPDREDRPARAREDSPPPVSDETEPKPQPRFSPPAESDRADRIGKYWAIWREVTKQMGSMKPHRSTLHEVAGCCRELDPVDEYGVWRQVLECYRDGRRESGKEIKLDWLLKDWDQWVRESGADKRNRRNQFETPNLKLRSMPEGDGDANFISRREGAKGAR